MPRTRQRAEVKAETSVGAIFGRFLLRHLLWSQSRGFWVICLLPVLLAGPPWFGPKGGAGPWMPLLVTVNPTDRHPLP